jgi:hypothetical protein
MGWGTRITATGSRIAAICCDPGKSLTRPGKKKDVWIRTRRFWLFPIPVNRKGWVLVLAVYGSWLAGAAGVLLKWSDEAMFIAFGIFAVCGLVAAPHTVRDTEE